MEQLQQKQNIRFRINTTYYEVEESLFSGGEEGGQEVGGWYGKAATTPEPESMEILSEGVLCEGAERVELSYDEGELTGMEGAQTSIYFRREEPGIVSMSRGGTISTTMVFEQGKRYHCVYKTPYMPFEVCVRTLKVRNDLLTEGRLYLDYVIEIRGAKAERTKLLLKVLP